ncbi:MAG: hypothetical protein JW827_03620 [Spirochaetes bacterium]|nr:hypothetical protein [Spirochaetota bacterium]
MAKSRLAQAIRDGQAFAESNYSALIKLESRGNLKEITGIEAIPDVEEEIDTLIKNDCLPVAIRTFSHDEKYNKRSDFQDQLNAFVAAFIDRLKELLIKHSNIN